MSGTLPDTFSLASSRLGASPLYGVVRIASNSSAGKASYTSSGTNVRTDGALDMTIPQWHLQWVAKVAGRIFGIWF